ncbi:hypothetical protein HZA56_08270 [Candidatus Poribacteria bacterium]|nr:hypothetical protein [Candidatus Poribacteria bacterium]
MLNDDAGYKRLFLLAAAYNLALGLVFLLLFSQIVTFLHMAVPPPQSAVFHQMAILLAMVFGIGYYMVSRDLYGQRGIVVLGIIAKTTVFLLFLYHVLFSGLHLLLFIIGVGDLIFALLFYKYIRLVRIRASAGAR